jgi:hypothetical protein
MPCLPSFSGSAIASPAGAIGIEASQWAAARTSFDSRDPIPASGIAWLTALDALDDDRPFSGLIPPLLVRRHPLANPRNAHPAPLVSQ